MVAAGTAGLADGGQISDDERASRAERLWRDAEDMAEIWSGLFVAEQHGTENANERYNSLLETLADKNATISRLIEENRHYRLLLAAYENSGGLSMASIDSISPPDYDTSDTF